MPKVGVHVSVKSALHARNFDNAKKDVFGEMTKTVPRIIKFKEGLITKYLGS